MVPPLVRAGVDRAQGVFTEVEQENGRAAWLFGELFITGSAIPFAAADPLRGTPGTMLGPATTGALSMLSGVTPGAPRGGVLVRPLIGKPLLIVVGTLISTVAVILLEQLEAALPGVPRLRRTPLPHVRDYLIGKRIRMPMISSCGA
jgi:fructose PTS system EIIBC or EIIC component